MFAYAARQAIFDQQQKVIAYELLFRDGKSNCFPNIEPDEATSKLLTNTHLNSSLEEITDGKIAYINFHQDTLLYRFPTFLDPHSVVIEVIETVSITPQLIKACRHIRDLGYRLALDDYDFDPKWDVLLPLVHIVKVDISEHDIEQLAEPLAKLAKKRLKLVAERIETHEELERCQQLGFDFFQGYYFAKPQLIRSKHIPASKMALVELIGASACAEFDFDKINQIIKRDVALSYMLLRFINNPTINKTTQITSMRHALNYMGQVEVKKFIALLALANLGDNKPIELLMLSLVRAKFCELLSKSKKQNDNPPSGFLVGLFSLLDAILDQQMSDVLSRMPLNDDLKQALCGSQNDLRNYLSLVLAFENANWIRVKQLASELELDQRMLHSFYTEAVKWGNAMKNSVQ